MKISKKVQVDERPEGFYVKLSIPHCGGPHRGAAEAWVEVIGCPIAKATIKATNSSLSTSLVSSSPIDVDVSARSKLNRS